MKEQLAKEFTNNLEKGLRATNSAISQLSSWFQWITAVFALGVSFLSIILTDHLLIT